MKKKIIIVMTCIVLSILACQKETKQIPPTEARLLTYLDSMLASVGSTDINDVFTTKFEGNFGAYSYATAASANCGGPIDTWLSGTVTIDTSHSVLINAGDLYVNNLKADIDNSNQYYTNQQGSTMLDNMYGKDCRVKLIKENDTIFNTHFYLPKNIIMGDYNCSLGYFNNQYIKPDYKISWNADYNNINGVVIELQAIDNTGVERYLHILVPDNGYYNFSEDDLKMYPKEKNRGHGIDVTLIRGGFVFLKGKDNKRYNFSFVSHCGFKLFQE